LAESRTACFASITAIARTLALLSFLVTLHAMMMFVVRDFLSFLSKRAITHISAPSQAALGVQGLRQKPVDEFVLGWF
jgi:hypothetical protein